MDLMNFSGRVEFLGIVNRKLGQIVVLYIFISRFLIKFKLILVEATKKENID